MSTKTRQTTPHVPAQRGADRRAATTSEPHPAEGTDHRLRNITLLVTTAVIALGAVLILWFGVFAGEDDPQAPAGPDTTSQGSGDGQTDFLRRMQEQPVGPERALDGSDTLVPGSAQVPDAAQVPDNAQIPKGAQ